MTAPIDFRTRPADIQAMRHDGSPDIAATIYAWSGCRVTASPGSDALLVYAPNSYILVAMGDWLVRGEFDRLYPMDDHLFHEVFEPIGGDEIPPDNRPCVCETTELMAKGCRCGGR